MPSAPTTDRTAPHNLEAERALLGTGIQYPEALADVLKILGVGDFYSQAHQIVFAKIKALAEKQIRLDLVTLCEELQNDGNLEKAGGAGYLSKLTDGVAMGSTAGLPEYCRIVKSAALKRQLINSAQNMIARALQGTDDADVLIGLAQAQFADLGTELKDSTPTKPETKEEVKAKAAKKEGRYPIIPPAAWHPAAELYRQAVAYSSEASDNWHFISFYTTLGALLGATVWGQMGSRIFPNLYSVLVGMVGGDGKSTAVNFAFDFAKMLDDKVYIPNTVDSKAGFIKTWAIFNQQNGVGKEDTRAVIRLGELRSLLDTASQTGTHSVIPMLNDAYDCMPLSNDSVATPYKVERPRLAAVFASAYKYLHQMKAEDLETGFGRRLCFCPGDAKGPLPYPDPPNQEVLIRLAQQVKEVLIFWANRENHKLTLAPDARKLWASWYKQYKGRLKSDDVIAAMTVGDRVSCQKVALMNAALDKSDRLIETCHLEPALLFGEYLYESRFPLFSKHGAGPNLEIEEKILARIPEPPGRMLRRALQQACHLDAKTFNDRLRYLEIEEVITTRRIGRRFWVWKNEE